MAEGEARLEPREERHRIPGPVAGVSLFLRRLAPDEGCRQPVVYVHGATFPSALSVAHLPRLEVNRVALWQDSVAFLGGTAEA